MRARLFYVVLACLFGGCSSPVERAVQRYHAAAPRVQLGMERDQVLLILKPTQDSLSLWHRKEPQMYHEYAGGQERFVEIFYFRSQTNYDGLLTDDEFTPYIFHDGKLAAVGWQALDGPKTHTQPTSRQDIFYDP